MALQVAAERDLTPWDALLFAVRQAAGRATWVDAQLTNAVARADGDVLGSDVVARWLRESRDERVLLARTAKAALDAGFADRLTRQVELEGSIVGEVIGRALDALELTAEQRSTVFAEAQRQLLVLDAPGDTS